jgi:hypothetical protein
MKPRNRRYRIVLSDGVTVTEVSKVEFNAHLNYGRIEVYKHDERKAATCEGYLSYVDFQTNN